MMAKRQYSAKMGFGKSRIKIFSDEIFTGKVF